MTDAAMADHVYVEPLTLDFLKKIIKSILFRQDLTRIIRFLSHL